MLRTSICGRLGIEYPILLAGMGGVSMHELTAAVSNAGGLGVLGGATVDAERLRREIRETRRLTDKPFAVDLLAPIPDMIRPQMQVIFEEDVKIFVAGLVGRNGNSGNNQLAMASDGVSAEAGNFGQNLVGGLHPLERVWGVVV
ncbi:MAG: nitronate monooxygenase, partial [Candidatus Binatia bacterium]